MQPPKASKIEEFSTQGSETYQKLLLAISSGQIAPGDRLRETEIAQRLGVSRTPVREAIRQLEADNLITHIPRVGAILRRLNYAEVTELYEMRAVLEGAAASLAARTASNTELAELESLNTALAMAKDVQTAQQLNKIFHATLLKSAKNRFLMRSMESLRKALMILGPTTLYKSERFETAVKEHNAVLLALHNRDVDEAEKYMRIHIQNAQLERLQSLRGCDETVA